MSGRSPSYTLYDVLGVQQSASIEEIRKAYKRCALKTHPDKLPLTASAMERQVAEAEFRLVSQALQVLSDAQRRKRYDQYLAAPSKPAKPAPQRTQTTPAPAKNTWDPFSTHREKLKKEREEWAKKVAKEHEERMRAFRDHIGPSTPRTTSKAAQEPQIRDPLVKQLFEELRAKNPEWVRREQEIRKRQAERTHFTPRYSTTT